MSRRIFSLRLVQRGGGGDALAALLRGEGINKQRGRADEALWHGGSRLDGRQLIHQCCIDAVAERGQGLRQDKGSLGAVSLDLTKPTGIHHRHIGAQTLADGFIGGVQFVFEQFQGE